MRLQAERCPGCGHPRTETFDPLLERDWKVSTRRCHACATRDRFLADSPDLEKHGLFTVVTRTPEH